MTSAQTIARIERPSVTIDVRFNFERGATELLVTSGGRSCCFTLAMTILLGPMPAAYFLSVVSILSYVEDAPEG